MRRFVLYRNEDVSGVSGVGVRVWGVQWPDGAVAYRWNTPLATTCVADKVEDVVAIHGHNGATMLIWVDSEEVAQRWREVDRPDGRTTG
ncbi:hypothetical protein [Microbispora sp. NPDC049125]|uniref:hypothetical protein n=1 Tax=Microbispora sp. NPDC049125 TaxID=3154929 RepID=UPI0034672EB1